MIKIRLIIIKIVLFFPCCVLDGLTLAIIHIPIWLVCGYSVLEDREPLLQWLFEKTIKQD